MRTIGSGDRVRRTAPTHGQTTPNVDWNRPPTAMSCKRSDQRSCGRRDPESLSATCELDPRRRKLAAAETGGLGRTRILYRRVDVERLRVERGVGRYGRT